MSNKTRLEAVSSALDTAINTANSLPDAGGGSGGSNIETCALTVSNGSSSVQLAIYYSNGNNFNPIEVEPRDYGSGDAIIAAVPDCIVNSLVTIVGASDSWVIDGSAELVRAAMLHSIFYVSGDATLSFTGF